MNFRSISQLAIGAIGVMSCVATAAPPPPPNQSRESNSALFEARNALLQARRFEAAGLPIPSPPANGGQCVIDTSGRYAPAAGQTGASGTYRYYEIQRWVVTSTPTNPGQNPLRYAVQWSTTGNGERHEDNGVGTRNDWTYAVSGTSNAVLTATKLASTGNWAVQTASTSAPSGITMTQQQTVTGSPPQSPRTSQTAAASFGYPPVSVPSVSTGATQLTEAKTYAVPKDVNWGYPRPAYATGTISCSWTVTVGP